MVVGAKTFVNACSGLPTHTHNYFKMLEFAKKKCVKINSPPLNIDQQNIFPTSRVSVIIEQ
jgi:hypothetical protein